MIEDMRPDISIVAPVYDNADSLRALIERIDAVFSLDQGKYEIVFVVDGSPDESDTILADIAASRNNIKHISLPTNKGQQRAILEGLRNARGLSVIVMDADLQDRPEAIPKILKHAKSSGADAVFAIREGVHQNFSRMATSWIFKFLISVLSGLPRNAGCYVWMSRPLVNSITQDSREPFYLLAAIARSGSQFSGIPVQRAQRVTGESSYSSLDRVRLGFLYLRAFL